MPLHEINAVMLDMSHGKLDAHMTGDYQGEFLTLKNTVNSALSVMSGYVREIIALLERMADKHFDQSVAGQYMGGFAPIKTYIDEIMKMFNQVMGGIHEASDRIDDSLNLLSAQGMSLSNISEEQIKFVDDVMKSLSDITQKKNTKQAENLTLTAAENLKRVTLTASDLISAINDIKASTDNMPDIIQAIDDIAFQANLLALSASAEAGRASIYGDFTVVAKEAQRLASRSDKAARETSVLLLGSISKVNMCVDIANETSEAIRKIEKSFSAVSGIVSEIALESLEQTRAINDINRYLGKTYEGLCAMTAIFEETPHVVSPLSHQSEEFRKMLSDFKLA
jgi:methyl-accepting chemotaxis protein